MKISSKFLYLEVKNFFREKTVRWAITGLVLFGLYSFYHGKKVIGSQLATISSIPAVQKTHLQHIAEEGKGKTVGTTAYYPFFYTANYPSPWASFSIGQRDVNAFSLKIKILGIEGQLYDSELTNPLTLLVGNLDAAFVFIFLFPLLIIAFTYNTVSQEQEHGVWRIVETNAPSLLTIIFIKLLVRFSAVVITASVVFLAGVLLLGLPFSGPTFQLFGVIICYLLFWFLLCAFVISLGKSSSFNATALVSCWIFLCMLFPGIANVLISGQIAIPEALETTVRQREGYHAKWDLPKKPTMETFYAAYPQYRKYPIPENEYSAGWYYAMQYAGEVEARESAGQLFEKLAQRQALAEQIGMLNPVIYAQQMLNRVAATDLTNHIEYLQSVKRYHKQLREYFYPHIFENEQTENLDWTSYPKYQPQAVTANAGSASVLPLVVWSLLAGLSATLLLRRNFIQYSRKQNA
ncbi:ABC transporter permease [Dyadobacter sp.]|uniref:ABC transporter permease n=1 Tax=Dyadobacter sp. TaxID=1914288 RepID=UPI003F6F8ED3